MFRTLFAWVHRYERHLSALAMVAGFVADNLLFGRVDVAQTQFVFAAYTAICFAAIPLMHWLTPRFERTRVMLQITTQFALGGFWSGFVIFYGRSAVFGASWPFLIFVFIIFLASEYFHQYHARLVFTSVLFFFALYSYAIFAVPVATGSIGTGTFLLSGVIAIGVFALFTMLLRAVARERLLAGIWRIRAGAVLVLIVMNISYFANILPPLPLSAEAGGIYHLVTRVPGSYQGSAEAEPWTVRYLELTPTLHVAPGDSLYAFSAVFAPTRLATTITHRWEWFDPMLKAWVTKAVVSYPIVGGRDGGYSGYSTVGITAAGQWRVEVETADGRLVDRLPFTVAFVATPVATQTQILR